MKSPSFDANKNEIAVVVAPELTSHKRTCCSIAMQDARSSFFGLEQTTATSVDHAMGSPPLLDIRAVFTPDPLWRTILIRSFLFVFSFVTFIYDLCVHPEPWIYFGYLTIWGMVFSLTYQFSILVCSLQRFRYDKCLGNDKESERGVPSNLYLIRFAWVMYTVAAGTEITLTALFWLLIYEPGSPVTYENACLHGVVGILVLLDGNLVCSIPVRIKHLIALEFTSTLYVAWNMIHGYKGIGKTRNSNGVTDGAPLYDVVDWKGNPKGAFIMIALVLFVAVPVVFSIVWMLSIKSYIFPRQRGEESRLAHVSENQETRDVEPQV